MLDLIKTSIKWGTQTLSFRIILAFQVVHLMLVGLNIRMDHAPFTVHLLVTLYVMVIMAFVWTLLSPVRTRIMATRQARVR